MRKVLVTGATGFIGGHLCETLAGRGYEVLALGRRTPTDPWLKMPGIRFFHGDVTQRGTLEEPVRQADIIVHAAGMLRGRDLAELLGVNCEGTRNLLDLMTKQTVSGVSTPGTSSAARRFILISSLAAGGPGIEESKPVSLYGESKLAAEQVAHEYAARLSVAILRLPPVYGPRDRAMLPIFQMAHAGFRPSLDLVISTLYITDAVEAVVQLAEHSTTGIGPFTACDGPAHTADEWTTELMRAFGRKAVPLRVSRKMIRFLGWWMERFSPDLPTFNRDKATEFACSPWNCTNDALHAQTGFEPKYDLATALRLTVDWYRENGWL
jgi:nucleoside-diphosphate-sugar epimerase